MALVGKNGVPNAVCQREQDGVDVLEERGLSAPLFHLFPAEPLERFSIQLKVLLTLPLPPAIVSFGDLLPFPHETSGGSARGAIGKPVEVLEDAGKC